MLLLESTTCTNLSRIIANKQNADIRSTFKLLMKEGDKRRLTRRRKNSLMERNPFLALGLDKEED